MTTSSSSASPALTKASPPEYSSIASKEERPIEIVKKSTAPIPPKSKKRYVKAVYDFNSEDSEDLSFKMGDLIEVLDASDQYGWWVGKDSKGKKGNFPSNYVMEQ